MPSVVIIIIIIIVIIFIIVFIFIIVIFVIIFIIVIIFITIIWMWNLKIKRKTFPLFFGQFGQLGEQVVHCRAWGQVIAPVKIVASVGAFFGWCCARVLN